MLELLPIIGQVVPWLATQIFGDKTGELTKAATDIVQQVFGTSDPDAINRSIATDPAKALEFKRLLLELQDKESQRQHEERMAEFTDRQNGRGLYGGPSKGVVDALTLLTVLLFFLCNAAVLFGCYKLFIAPKGSIEINEFTIAIASLVSSVTTYVNSKADVVWNFFFGSSSGSAAKTDAMNVSISKALSTALSPKK